ALLILSMERIKEKNTEYLASLQIEVPDHLPIIESLEEVNPRSPSDIASRLCALAYVIGLGFGAKASDLMEYLEKYNLIPFVSNYEKDLLSTDTIEEQDKLNMSWLTECAQSLAWCVGLVELDHFKHCDDDLAEKIPFKKIQQNLYLKQNVVQLNKFKSKQTFFTECIGMSETVVLLRILAMVNTDSGHREHFPCSRIGFGLFYL
ncbi:MAG: DUF4272 domain-containing protein, partial [Methylococcales bacterium]